MHARFDFRVSFPWFGYSGYKISVILTCMVMLLGVWALLTRTRIGLIMRATQYDRETAQAFGIPVARVYTGVFAFGAMLAAVAAVLMGSLKGTVLAAVVIGLSDGIITIFFDPTLAKILSTILVAMILVFRPTGLFGTATR